MSQGDQAEIERAEEEAARRRAAFYGAETAAETEEILSEEDPERTEGPTPEGQQQPEQPPQPRKPRQRPVPGDAQAE